MDIPECTCPDENCPYNWFVWGRCTICEEDKLIFPPYSDSAGLCEGCWLDTK